MESLKSINKALGETAKFYQKYLNDSAPSDFKFHLSNGIEKLVEDNAELREAIDSAMRIKDLWLPFHVVANEHEGEAVELHRMYNKFEKLLNK